MGSAVYVFWVFYCGFYFIHAAGRDVDRPKEQLAFRYEIALGTDRYTFAMSRQRYSTVVTKQI